ncbi:MAG TPA: ferritin family protein [Anaerohalosphaeraceae bacterium]|nr:ferritin family protein [Anaerohalosphaeraceae bacterium]HOL89163.1 ferritin family protein [Anaerohalosphaeraceae bacterium]HPP56354.1 ferritin family protein [Anaerohalosphaeraceae bacterium]
MAITFNADEIFEIAERIESNAARFYREAAGKAAKTDLKKMLLDLSAMEEGHEKTFALMRKDLAPTEKGATVYDPDGEAAQYLKTMADFHGTEGKAGPMEKLTGKESMAELLRIAINAEKDSIAFYVGIRGLVPSKSGKDKIEKIIVEEMSHVTALGAKLQSL